MAEKTDFENVDVTSLSNVLNLIQGVFNVYRKPAPELPPGLLLAGKRLRPGMSARNLAARIITRLESDANIPMGDVFNDGPNTEALKMRVISEEIVTMLQTEAKVDISIDPGSIFVQVTGNAGPGFPVIAAGANINPINGGGGVR